MRRWQDSTTLPSPIPADLAHPPDLQHLGGRNLYSMAYLGELPLLDPGFAALAIEVATDITGPLFRQSLALKRLEIALDTA